MRLTNDMRDAFIRAAMNDVPRVDHREEIRKLVLADAVEALPAAVRKLWDNKALNHWVKTETHYFHHIGVVIPSASPGSSWRRSDHKLSATTLQKVAELKAAMDAADKLHDELKQKLKAAAYGCTTRKQLAALLPEFEKYLPADEVKAIKQNLPAVANIMADFTKAGWPKGKQPESK